MDDAIDVIAISSGGVEGVVAGDVGGWWRVADVAQVFYVLSIS